MIATKIRLLSFFFFNDTATTEIYTLSLHDALPILSAAKFRSTPPPAPGAARPRRRRAPSRATPRDRKSTRLNSSHSQISYAVFCLKKKNHAHAPPLTHIAQHTLYGVQDNLTRHSVE